MNNPFSIHSHISNNIKSYLAKVTIKPANYGHFLTSNNCQLKTIDWSLCAAEYKTSLGPGKKVKVDFLSPPYKSKNNFPRLNEISGNKGS